MVLTDYGVFFLQKPEKAAKELRLQVPRSCELDPDGKIFVVRIGGPYILKIHIERVKQGMSKMEVTCPKVRHDETRRTVDCVGGQAACSHCIT